MKTNRKTVEAVIGKYTAGSKLFEFTRVQCKHMPLNFPTKSRIVLLIYNNFLSVHCICESWNKTNKNLKKTTIKAMFATIIFGVETF